MGAYFRWAFIWC